MFSYYSCPVSVSFAMITNNAISAAYNIHICSLYIRMVSQLQVGHSSANIGWASGLLLSSHFRTQIVGVATIWNILRACGGQEQEGLSQTMQLYLKLLVGYSKSNHNHSHSWAKVFHAAKSKVIEAGCVHLPLDAWTWPMKMGGEEANSRDQ